MKQSRGTTGTTTRLTRWLSGLAMVVMALAVTAPVQAGKVGKLEKKLAKVENAIEVQEAKVDAAETELPQQEAALVVAQSDLVTAEALPQDTKAEKKARKKAPTNTDVKGMLHKAEEELEAAESLEEGEKLAKKKRYKEAIEHFKEVPNSSEQFSEAQDAIKEAKARGRTVVIMAHRPSAIAACDLLLMLDKGNQIEFGPRDGVPKKRTRNYR